MTKARWASVTRVKGTSTLHSSHGYTIGYVVVLKCEDEGVREAVHEALMEACAFPRRADLEAQLAAVREREGALLQDQGAWTGKKCAACSGTGEREDHKCNACGGTGEEWLSWKDRALIAERRLELTAVAPVHSKADKLIQKAIDALKPIVAATSQKYPADSDWHYPAKHTHLVIGNVWKAEEALSACVEYASEDRPAAPEPEPAAAPLSFASLAAACKRRNVEWLATGDALGKPEFSASFRAAELVGEVAEALIFCNTVKKLERERLGVAGSRASVIDLAKELADVIICTTNLANHFGIDLGFSTAAKFNEASTKLGFSTMLPIAAAAAPEDEEWAACLYCAETGSDVSGAPCWVCGGPGRVRKMPPSPAAPPEPAAAPEEEEVLVIYESTSKNPQRWARCPVCKDFTELPPSGFACSACGGSGRED